MVKTMRSSHFTWFFFASSADNLEIILRSFNKSGNEENVLDIKYYFEVIDKAHTTRSKILKAQNSNGANFKVILNRNCQINHE